MPSRGAGCQSPAPCRVCARGPRYRSDRSLRGGEFRANDVGSGSSTPVRLIEPLTYGAHRKRIRASGPWAAASEKAHLRAAFARWRLYFETGRWRRDFLINRMTGSGRVRLPAVAPVSGQSIPPGLDRSVWPPRRSLHERKALHVEVGALPRTAVVKIESAELRQHSVFDLRDVILPTAGVSISA